MRLDILFLLCVSRAVALDLDNIRFLGRFDFTSSPAADWSGTGIVLSIEPSAPQSMISIQYGDCGSDCYIGVDVMLDGELNEVYTVQSNLKLDLRFDLAVGTVHEVALIKRTEAHNGDARGSMIIDDITLTNATLIAPAASSTRVLFIGDSLTAAYGVDGIYPCDFSADTENVLHSYASLVGEDMQAEINIVAWSGKGVVRNYGENATTSTNPLPTYYNRTLATNAELYWSPASAPVDIIVVMLGTNDYSTDPMPSDEEFTSGYISFLSVVQTDYPSARIVTVCAPYQRGNQCANIETAALLAEVEYVYMSPALATCPELCGCDGHPNAQGQRNMADALLEVLRV